MKISNLFEGVGAKRLSLVEVDAVASNQHEFNGVSQFQSIFGENKLEKIPTDFIYLTDNENEIVEDTGTLTWYDARENHPTRSEYRLYFTSNKVINKAKPSDLLIIAKRTGTLPVLVLIIQNNSTVENQMIWLFGFGDKNLEKFYVSHFDSSRFESIDFASELILNTLGIELPQTQKEDSFSEYLLKKYPIKLPETKVFSDEIFNFLHKNNQINLIEEPDKGLILLLQKEEFYFKLLEKHYVEKKLKAGFDNVEEFISYSLKIQNTRKSRAGYAFENHLEKLFKDNNIQYDRTKVTEYKSKPDFIFPSIAKYHTPSFPQLQLSMLGVKTTCKDRWRQILSEAQRIKTKHLATLEPSISQNQTDEMKGNNVFLVIPESIHKTYKETQLNVLLTVSEFLQHLRNNQ